MNPRTFFFVLLSVTVLIGCKKNKKSDEFSPTKESLQIYKEIKQDQSTSKKKKDPQPSDYRRELKPQ